MGLSVDIEKQLKDMTLKVSFETETGQGITGILGASGCGKSMTLKCIAGIVSPDRGTITLNGRILYDSEKQINIRTRERRVGYLFQNYALFPHMTIRQNVEIGAAGVGREKRNRTEQYLRLFQLEELADNVPGKLSGGQQQRAALARILASAPDVLMLDEPFSALDDYLKDSLQIELLKVLQEYGGDILMVTHSRDEMYRFCNQIHILDRGRIAISGQTKAVFENPRVVAAAKLTGCKNIARATISPSGTIRIPQWNMELFFDGSIPEDIGYVGIRAHFLRKRVPEEIESKKSGKKIRENILVCRTSQVVEDLFEITVIINESIWWKLSREEWEDVYHRQIPEELILPQESILLLKKEEPLTFA